MTRSLTKAAADKLGDRLRKGQDISEQDLRLLQDFRRDYDEPLIQVQRVLREDLNLDATSRIKTPNTILEKLRRDKTRLSSMQDIAGVRIVKKMELVEQDAMVTAICAHFPQHRIEDRRSKPSHGYRAVHVIVSVDGFPVEIQVRTADQHLWAELFEKMADHWGRQIRYGLPPDEPNLVGGRSRTDIVEIIMDASKSIELVESSPLLVEPLQNLLDSSNALGPPRSGRIKRALTRLRLKRFRTRAEKSEARIKSLLADLLGEFSGE